MVGLRELMEYGYCGWYDWESWDQNPKVSIERGKFELNGPPHLKNRKRMRRGLAIKLWKELLSTGWRRVDLSEIDNHND
tara:strand:+ start:280 stop:516 length:237 start_codon:yes stop_codon:yes gene_type:complete